MFIAILALPAVACGTQGSTPIAPAEYTLQQASDSIPLPYRRDVKVGSIWMTFTGVSSDSRCPRNVTCVWMGDAVTALSVHPECYKSGCEAASTSLSLHTHLEPRSGQALGYRVQLLALDPEPVAGTTPDVTRYVAWVRVSQ